MSDAFAILGAGMINDLDRLSMISHNLANSTTSGYKKQIPVNSSFVDYISSQSNSVPGSDKLSMMSVSIPQVVAKMDDSQGTMKFSSNPLDLVVNENNYFSVLTTNGVAYTKQGSFKINQNGLLVDKNNNPVMGESGEIYLSDSDVQIGKDGVIKSGDNIVGKLFVANIPDSNKLTNIGQGLFVASDRVEIADSSNVNVSQGYLEMSNVTLMEEMIRLIEVTRHFETTQRFMMGYDSMLDNAINVVGQV